MKTKFIFLLTVLFAFSYSTSFAQGCEDDVAPAAGQSGVPSTSSMTVFGYIQPQYTFHQSSQDNMNSFSFKRARLGVRGRVNRSFSYYVVLEASAFIGSGDAYLLDAFITYDKYDWAKFSLGSFKQPFGRDVTTACHSLTTIDRSLVADQLVAPQRDMGLMMLGGSGKTKFRYSLALMNGRGLGFKDNNKKKDIIGRATYQVFDFLNVGASFRYGYPMNDEDNPSNNIKDDHIRKTFGVDALVKYKDLTVQGEYIKDEGDISDFAGGGCGSEPLALGNERQGAYVMASYNINEKIQPVIKYEFFDQDLDQDVVYYQEMTTLGLNYFFNKKTRLQVNYQMKTIDSNTNDNDAFLMQLQVRF